MEPISSIAPFDTWDIKVRPEILIDPRTWYSALAGAQHCPIEYSWFSRVEALPENRLRVSGFVIPRQVCSGGFTHLSAQMFSALDDELKSAGEDSAAYSRVWGHSHVDMDAYMSSVDYSGIQGRVACASNDGNNNSLVGPLVSIVINRSGKHEAWVNFARPYVWWPVCRVSLDPRPSNEEAVRIMRECARSVCPAIDGRVTDYFSLKRKEDARKSLARCPHCGAEL
jgi:hypothetical protein